MLAFSVHFLYHIGTFKLGHDPIIKANRANGKTRGEGIHVEFSIEKSAEANTRPVKIDFTTPGDHKGVAMIMPVKEAI